MAPFNAELKKTSAEFDVTFQREQNIEKSLHTIEESLGTMMSDVLLQNTGRDQEHLKISADLHDKEHEKNFLRKETDFTFKDENPKQAKQNKDLSWAASSANFG